jgi:hypothetical protein
MRLYRAPAQTGEKTNSVNMAVQVEAYLEDKGVVSVKGRRLETGDPVVVALTNRGDLASNVKRPSLDKFRDKKDNLGVDVGGVIGFDRCFPNNQQNGAFFGGWPTYLAGNGGADEMKRLKTNRDTTLQLRTANGTNKLFGTLSVWQSTNITEFDSLAKLESATAKWLNDVPAKIANSHGAAIMRARNSDGEVVAYTFVYARYNKDSGKHDDGDTTINNFKSSRAFEGFVKEAQAGGGLKWDIVPAVNLDLSPRSLEDGANALKATEKSFQRDGDLIAKGTTFVMDPNHKFVIKVMVHDPFGDSGIDPVLMGKNGNHVVYNAAFKAALMGGEAPAQSNQAEHEQVAAAPVDTGPSIEV